MYNAMASFESQGSKGSTRLHMDMADAINIMTYASLTPSGRPGCAAWDIFRAEDTSKLRKFLKKKFKGQYQHDPIHSQQFYLDSSLRQELYKDYGVMSHRVYQRPGDAVFIPAGCAHQVSPRRYRDAKLWFASVHADPCCVCATGVQPRGLHQGRVRLCQP